MKAFRIFFNEETNKFDCDDKKTEVQTVAIDSPVAWNAYYDTAINAVISRNHELEEGKLFAIRCRDCDTIFIQTKEERDWFKDRDLTPPKRCDKCRKNNRAMNRFKKED